MKKWYEGTEIEKKIPDFKSIYIRYITNLYYYIDYNSHYDQISFLEITFLLEVDIKKFTLNIKFSDVSSFDLTGFGNSFNQLVGFEISNLNNNGFEKNNKYLVEDYEDGSIKFYCASIEIVSLDEV
ncbi:hypothetical protein [Priestia taiwanensis]|uniref:Uncharacterized protein n=1 Tax=Priestia taiwanensis TaxID=1347902 RepID=A0A917AIN3_9BACI|nr:hypothetical protein [Priestia taiwanensis]MBM7361378.1 hypothetical protein [Priestia taiwanensis]GGE53691.1 hypothetical protein GCM10007140_00010 [Priestia taiwanensis]